MVFVECPEGVLIQSCEWIRNGVLWAYREKSALGSPQKLKDRNSRGDNEKSALMHSHSFPSWVRTCRCAQVHRCQEESSLIGGKALGLDFVVLFLFSFLKNVKTSKQA